MTSRLMRRWSWYFSLFILFFFPFNWILLYLELSPIKSDFLCRLLIAFITYCTSTATKCRHGFKIACWTTSWCSFLSIDNCYWMQAVSCDEAFLDATDSGVEDIQIFVSVIREEILDATGCTASAGIAGNMLMARLATRIAKPDGQCYIPAEKVAYFKLSIWCMKRGEILCLDLCHLNMLIFYCITKYILLLHLYWLHVIAFA